MRASPSVTDRPCLATLELRVVVVIPGQSLWWLGARGRIWRPLSFVTVLEKRGCSSSWWRRHRGCWGVKRPLGEKQVVICKLKPLRVRNIVCDSHRGCALWYPANLPSQSNDEYQLFWAAQQNYQRLVAKTLLNRVFLLNRLMLLPKWKDLTSHRSLHQGPGSEQIFLSNNKFHRICGTYWYINRLFWQYKLIQKTVFALF